MMTQDEIYEQVVRFLPPGRALGASDGTIRREQSILRSLLYAMAGVLADADTAIDAMVDEFYCSTTSDDRDLWNEEYGLPDDCNIFGDDLCAKSTFRGGVSLAYYASLAEALGVSAALQWLKGDHADYPGVHSTLLVVIDAANSSAFVDEIFVDDFEVEDAGLGDPDVSSFVCALERVIPAHCEIIYELVE